MALFTRLDEAAAADVAARFRFGQVASVEPLWAGTVNSNFRFTTDAGVFFVRINEEAGEADVAYEGALVSFLAARGVPTPGPVPSTDGAPYAEVGGRLITAFPWVAGAHREPDPTLCGLLGQALARVHLAGAGFDRRRESRYAFPRIVERWQGVAARVPLDDDVRGALVEVAEETAWLEAHRRPLPAGVIHGDLFPDNVLFDGDRLSALIDFEQASDGVFAYDLAVCLCSWAYGDDFDPARAAALVRGYASVRPLGDDERAGLYVESRAAAMRFTVTRITDVELNPAAAEQTKKTKDFRRYQARLRRLRALGAAGFAQLIG